MNNYPQSVHFLASMIKEKKSDASPHVRALVAGAQAVLDKVVPGYSKANTVPIWNHERMEVLHVLAQAYAFELRRTQ